MSHCILAVQRRRIFAEHEKHTHWGMFLMFSGWGMERRQENDTMSHSYPSSIEIHTKHEKHPPMGECFSCLVGGEWREDK